MAHQTSRSRRAVCAATALLGAAVLAACGSGGSGDSGGGPTVAATTGLLAEITKQVAGPDAEVKQVIPAAASPHEFKMSAKDRAEIEDSDLLVHNGANLEQSIPFGDIDVPQFALADHAGKLRPFDEDGAKGEDPHVWMDPTKVAAALPALADELAKIDPPHAAGYHQRAKRYAAQLQALDAELTKTLTAIPKPDRQLVTSHEALGYFADRYNFIVVATPFPASGPEAQPSAAKIKAVEDAVRSSGIPTVFAQQDDDPEVLARIAAETGVKIVEDLHVEGPNPGESYPGMLRRDADLIRQGLAG